MPIDVAVDKKNISGLMNFNDIYSNPGMELLSISNSV